ncbi:MAG: ABC transporter permease [Bacteroidaceae bacterium]
MDRDKFDEIISVITRNKTRSFLTAFGIFWGIFMWVLLMGGGQGLQRMLSRNFDGFATNSVLLYPEKTGLPYKGFNKRRSWTMKMQDVERVKHRVSEVDIASPVVSRWNEVKRNNIVKSYNILGLLPNYIHIEGFKIKGRFINEIDVKETRNVCVLDKRMVDELFADSVPPIGQSISINGVYFKVVGVNNREEGGSNIRIPLTSMQQLYRCGSEISMLALTVKPGNTVSDVAPKVMQVIKQVNMINPNDTEAITFVNFEAMFQMIDSLFSGISILVWLIGIGTLLSGAVGVSNIMMVTVKERTSEIGIRRAIGARPNSILGQIIMESVVLTIAAGLFGIMFAVLVLAGVESGIQDSPFAGISFQIPFTWALASAATLTLLGVAAGIAPALRALSIRPVDAMREE